MKHEHVTSKVGKYKKTGKEAFNQINRYALHSFSGLFDFVQIFVISNGIESKYFANGRPNELKFEFTFFWKDEENKNTHPKSWSILVNRNSLLLE